MNTSSSKNHLILLFGYLWVLSAYLAVTPAFFRAFGSETLSYAYNLFRYGAYFFLLLNFIIMGRLITFKGYYVAVFTLFSAPTLGLALWNVDQYFVRHIISLTLPIVGVISGMLTYRHYNHYLALIARLFERYAIVPVLLVFAYFTLYQLGVIVYLGVSNALPLVLSIALVRNKPALATVAIFGLLLAAKRSELISSVVILYIYFSTKGNIVQNIAIIIVFGMVAYSTQFFLPGLWGRFELFFRLFEVFSELNEDVLNLATGGRLQDAILAYSLIDEPWKAIFGVGAGFWYFLDADYTVYYSHFTPLSYFVLGGGIYLTWVTIFIASTLIFTNKSERDFYFYAALYYTIISIVGGAVLFTSIMGWFCLGVVYAGNKQKRYDLKLRKVLTQITPERVRYRGNPP